MDTTTPQITNRIVAAVVTRFATDNEIEPSHLLTEPDSLTPVEILRASRALGSEVLA